MAEQTSTIELQVRDVLLFRSLYESRVMTIDQIASICFDGKREMARKRITKLKTAGYVSYRPKDTAAASTVVTLAKAGHDALIEGHCLSDLPHMPWPKLQKRLEVGSTILAHELEVVDVKAAFLSMIPNLPGYRIAECSTWPALHAFETFAADGDPVSVYPDGFMRIERMESDAVYESSYYIEVDRSTERLDRILERCVAYREHYRTGGFAASCGHDRSEYRDFYFRVLITCKSAERRNNIALRLLSLSQPIRSQVWLTTHTELMKDPLGAIWVRPKDFESTASEVANGIAKQALFRAAA